MDMQTEFDRAERSQRVADVLSRVDPAKYVSGLGGNCVNKLTRGCLVVTGPQAGSPGDEFRIGYCLQIRTGVGAFGSDIVFLRHPNGRIWTHENQGFFLMTEEQESLARPLFEKLPEQEDYSQGFKCPNDIREVGFIVENSDSKPMEVTLGMTITTRKDK